MSDLAERLQICIRCEFHHLQAMNPATGRHRKLCASPGTDSTKWLVMDDAFLAGPDSNCPKGKWLSPLAIPNSELPIANSQLPAAARRDLTGCAPCKEKLLAEMKEELPIANSQLPISNSQFPISVVIASLNEKEDLVATVASVKADCPDAEIIVVDDASAQPEPICAIRNPKRIGGPRSRRLGALRAKGDVVVFMDAHSALDWETACAIARRYPEVGRPKPEFKEILDRPNKIRRLAAAALGFTAETQSTQRTAVLAMQKNPFSAISAPPRCKSPAIVYGGCMFSCGRAGACLVHEKGMLGGRWMKRRPDLPPLELWPTSLLMGAFYAIPRTILDDFGGWPALPNYHGAQELAVALMAAAHRVPILFHDGVALWHLFRGPKTGVEVPFHVAMENGAWLGYAAAWRLVLDDAHWKDYRSRLMAGQGPHGAIPEEVLRQVETPEFNRYRADAQSRFKLNSDELLAELERRMAADRDARVQGAEDKTLNAGKKILLAVTFSADAGTSSNAATLEEKRKILGRCLESTRASGAAAIALFVLADERQFAIANSQFPIANCQLPISVVPVLVKTNPGLPLGETRCVRAAIAEAVAQGYEWVVKICGDVFHPHPNWAQEMVIRAMAAPQGAALLSGVCDRGCAVTKVFAARTEFLARTWPEDAEVAPLGAGAVIERIWTAKIAALGLDNLWLKLPCRHVFEGKANWWTPVDPAFAYLHTHDAALAAGWKMEKP